MPSQGEENSDPTPVIPATPEIKAARRKTGVSLQCSAAPRCAHFEGFAGTTCSTISE